MVIRVQDIIVFDRNDYKCLNLSIKYNIEISASLLDAVKLADILILAIKPQNMPKLIKNIREVVTSRQVIVTVAAGIQTNAYERLFNKEICFARTIPNTSSSLGYRCYGDLF